MSRRQDPPRALPWQQASWDWRAAGNFIGGGAGGGLLVLAAACAAFGGPYAPLALLAMVLVAGGLFCVWLEIGRPLRALNVFRHVETSWMTREAMLAPLVFLSAGGAAWSGAPFLINFAALVGGLFLYAQARILAADKGIPAWRQAQSVPLLVASGLTEGAALLAALLPLLAASPRWPALLLLPLIALRAALWRAYLQALRREGAPVKALAVLARLDRPLLLAGHLAPAVLVAAGALAGLAWLSAAGALAALAGGWALKYVLLRRAGYTQGYALPQLPVRGRGRADPGVRPGWGACRNVARMAPQAESGDCAAEPRISLRCIRATRSEPAHPVYVARMAPQAESGVGRSKT